MLEYVGFKDLKEGLVRHVLRRINHNLFKGVLFNNQTRQTRVRSYATNFHCCFHFYFELFLLLLNVYIFFQSCAYQMTKHPIIFFDLARLQAWLLVGLHNSKGALHCQVEHRMQIN